MSKDKKRINEILLEDIESAEFDINKIREGKQKLKELLDERGNIKRDSEGGVLLSKDDEWDIIGNIFQEAIEKQGLSKEEVEKMIHKVIAEETFKNNMNRFVALIDDLIKKLNEPILDEKIIHELIKKHFESNFKIDKEKLDQMKSILSVDDKFLSKFKTKGYKRKVDEMKRRSKMMNKNIR